MTNENIALERVTEALESLRQELARLSQRVAALEVVAAASPSTAARPDRVAPTDTAEGLSDEMVMVIGAAIAAFLGKKAHVHQIRLLGSAAWLQQGRITVQASHAR